MKQENFGTWLAEQQPQTLHNDSPKSYISYLNSVEANDKIGNLDNYGILRLNEVLDLINTTNYSQAEVTLQKFKAAVKKYWEFRESTGN